MASRTSMHLRALQLRLVSFALPRNHSNGPPTNLTCSRVKQSTMTINTYAPTAVKKCHQP